MFDLNPAHDDLRKPVDRFLPAPEPESHASVWIGATMVVAVAAGGAAYFAYGRQHVSTPVPQAPVPTEVSQPAAQPLAAAADPIVLPPLDKSDPLVRQMMKGVVAHPRAAAWLASNDLIRNFTIVVANVAEGNVPVRQLQMLRPLSSFDVIERGGRLTIDPSSYARYDGIAAAAAAIDPIGAARLYAELKPRIEEAYRSLGYPDTPFDRTLERAIVSLLEVPVLTDPVPVLASSHGIGYGFAATKLEALTDAQKQLLRTGPRNTRMVQASLREIAVALGFHPPV